MPQKRESHEVSEQERRLREFGLSDYATRAYLTLLKLGTAEARSVSRLARVPIAKIYGTLDQLAERGLCTIEPGPPKRFAPVHIRHFVEQLVAQHAAQAATLEAQKEELARLLPIAPEAHVGERGTFQVLRGRRATLEKLRQLYEARPQSVLLHAADGFTKRATAATLMQSARESGATVRILARIDATSVEPLQRIAGFAEIRAKERGMSNIMVGIFDTKAALITHFIPDDASSTRGQDVSLYTTEEAIVGALSAFVENEWDRAERFASARDRLARGDPAPRSRWIPTAEIGEAWDCAVAQSPGDFDVCLSLLPSAAQHLRVFRSLERGGQRTRILLNVADAEELANAERMERDYAGCEVRHVLPDETRICVALLGGRAYLSFRSVPGGAPADVFESTDARLVEALRVEFEERWRRGVDLAQRRAALAPEQS